VAATALAHGQPDYTRLIDLERRLRCRSCGNRGDNRILVTLAPRE
jgi:hypothetical protein